MSENEEVKEIERFIHRLESISKKISEHEVSKSIREFIEEKFRQNPPEIIVFELIAFDFIENFPREGMEKETYFGPV